jgi:tetratricopeptide (TPR) repeat protein
MKCPPRQLVQCIKSSQACFRKTVWVAIAIVGLLGSRFAPAQAPAHRASSTQKAPPAQDELTKRIAEASAARDSQNTDEVAIANERLIATALRDLAYLRLIEAAYPQAIELYKTSLDFEDSPATTVDMAMAEAQAGQYDEAIKTARKTQSAGYDDLRIDRILGSSLVQKGQFAEAVAPFTRVAKADPSIENLYALANCLLQTGKPEDKVRAQAVFDEMKETAGDSGSLHVLFGRAYRDGQDMPSAVREFQRAIALDPRAPHAHYFLGLAELSLNEWKPTPEAEAEIRKEAEYFPHDYLANYMLGFLLSSERQYDQAKPYLVAASQIDPTAPEPFLFLGLNAYAQNDMKLAEQMLRQAVELTGSDESRSNYQIRRAYVDLGRILTNSGRQEEAEVFLAKARELQNKTMEQSQQSIATIALAGGAGAAAAVMPLNPQQEKAAAPILEDHADPFARIDPETLAQSKLTPAQRTEADARETRLRTALALGYNDLATAEAKRGELPRALSYYQQAERWDSSFLGLEENLGHCAFLAGEYPEAIRALSLALKDPPKNAAPLRAMLGISYFSTNQYSDAVRSFAPLGVDGMLDGEAGYAWAASLAHTGDMKKASEVLTAYDSVPRSNDVTLLIGQLWTEIGDYPRAIATFERALQSNPALPKAHFYSGLAYIHWEHWPEAAKQFQTELNISPGDPDAEYHLGFSYLQQARADEAVALFRQVIASNPEYANAQYQVGKILLDRGQVADAVGYLEAAARLSPQSDYMHYQLQAAYRKEDRVAEADRELEIYKQLKARSRERATEAIKSNP